MGFPFRWKVVVRSRQRTRLRHGMIGQREDSRMSQPKPKNMVPQHGPKRKKVVPQRLIRPKTSQAPQRPKCQETTRTQHQKPRGVSWTRRRPQCSREGQHTTIEGNEGHKVVSVPRSALVREDPFKHLASDRGFW